MGVGAVWEGKLLPTDPPDLGQRQRSSCPKSLCCVCVCVCVGGGLRERERERDRKRARDDVDQHHKPLGSTRNGRARVSVCVVATLHAARHAVGRCCRHPRAWLPC